MNTLSQFYRLLRRRYRVQSKLQEQCDFSPNEAELLLSLSEAPEQNTAADICEREGISKSLVCRSVESLEKKGFLSLLEDENDKRCIRLSLNDVALPVVNVLKEEHRNIYHLLTHGITEEELNTFWHVVNIMLSNAKAK